MNNGGSVGQRLPFFGHVRCAAEMRVLPEQPSADNLEQQSKSPHSSYSCGGIEVVWDRTINRLIKTGP